MIDLNPLTALSGLGQAATDRSSIADDFDTFLSLLTTQLRNQNPLDPLDTNQFTEQLVQFTEVEQSVKLNENLEQLVKVSTASAITNVVSFLGGEVTIDGETAKLEDGSASWNYDVDESADGAIFTVRNAAGVPVLTKTFSVSAGPGRFVWDGVTDTGSNAPDGIYSLSITATDASGVAINVTTESVGTVQGIDLSGSEPVLLVDGQEVTLDQIKSVKLPSSGTT